MKKFICILLCLVLFSLNSYAIGISPAKRVYDFEPGFSKVIEFKVVNSEDEVINAELYVAGDLEEYFDLEKRNITIEPGERKPFKTKLFLPEDIDIAPGEHRTLIIAAELPEDIGAGTPQVGAVAAVGYTIIIKVPYDEKYLDVLIEPSEAEVGKDVKLKITLESLGMPTIDNVYGNLKIYNEDNESATTLTFQEKNIGFKEKREINLVWKSGSDEAGTYTAILDLDYDEKTKQVEQKFRIGDLLINILDLNEKEILKDKITLLEILTQSMWNKDIIGVYAELEIEGKRTKSSSVDYERWEEKIIPIYFDSTGLETGEYTAKVILFYENRTTEETFDIKIVLPFFSPANPLFYLTIIIIILLVMILFTLFKKRRLFKSKTKLE